MTEQFPKHGSRILLPSHNGTNKMKNKSEQWEQITKSFPPFNPLDKNWRRSGPIAGAFSVRDVETNGDRYWLMLLQLAAQNLSYNDITNLSLVKHRNYGNPYTVNCRGINIDMDYLKSIKEYNSIIEFSKSFTTNFTNILEIGAGYGRTAHTLLSLINSIRSYTIVDLPEVLEISKSYLEKVLTEEQFNKLFFITPTHFFTSSVLGGKIDLCINIDSMNEMDVEVVDMYLDYVSLNCLSFYCKNPIAKYDNQFLHQNTNYKNAISSGPIKKQINMFSDLEIQDAAPEYIKTYTPKDHDVLFAKHSEPFSYYYELITQQK